MLRAVIFVATLTILALPASAQSVDWQRYENSRFGYGIDLPMDLFEVAREADNGDGLTLTEVGGDGQLAVYGAFNVAELSASEFADEVERADRIREVTYRAGGRSWFVLSGYYRREGDEREDLIFYAKFMFNADRSAISAFEISYPRADKRRFDRIVARLEKSLRAPD